MIIIREEQFKDFLVKEESITSKYKAVGSRISKAKRVERELNIDLDQVVANDNVMYETLLAIKDKLIDKGGNFQNAVRKYYIFANNKEFPSLTSFKRFSYKAK